MKKVVLLCMIMSGVISGAAGSSSLLKSVRNSMRKSSVKSVPKELPFTPADFIITEIVNEGHNPATILGAEGYDATGEALSDMSYSLAPGESTADQDGDERRLHTVIRYEQDLQDITPKSLQKRFRAITGHGSMHTFSNTTVGGSINHLNHHLTKIETAEALLKPRPRVREVALIMGHAGNFKIRVPGSVKKQTK
jgi:hypothetical protein